MSRFFDPLTYRHPRTLAETQDQRFGWWTSGANVDVEERELRAQLGKESSSAIGHFVSMLAGVVALVGFAALLALMQEAGQ